MCLDNTQTSGPERPPVTSNPRLPGYVMHQTVQAICDREGAATTLALKYACHMRAFSDNERWANENVARQKVWLPDVVRWTENIPTP
jgi:hypothetical protein